MMMFTNSVVKANFYAYMRCRHSANQKYMYRHEYVTVGDKIFFENGLALELGKDFYLYNEITNPIPHGLMFNCLITGTTNLPNRCIWDCE